MNAGVTHCASRSSLNNIEIDFSSSTHQKNSKPFTAKQSAVTQELPLLRAAQATRCHAKTEICKDFKTWILSVHACMSSQSPEKGFVGTLITGEATDDLRMGVKILSEAYLVWSHTGATLFSDARFFF